MFDLPESCNVNKFIPKNTFYEHIAISSKLKDQFVNKVEKITWLYKLAESTINARKTDNVEEIEIFEIILRLNEIPYDIIKTISKSIPYKLLFVLKYNNNYIYAVCIDNKIYNTEWNEVINFNFIGLTLESIYDSIVRQIIKEKDTSIPIEKSIDRLEEIDNLKREISALENKVKHENQFNKKVELNIELNIELNKLKNELKIIQQR